ncbi:MAG: tyrosine-type recombinase/integrase, partial [Mycetocola sp.]
KKKALKHGEGSLSQRSSNGLWQGTFTYTDLDGKQVRKYVSSKDYNTALGKLAAVRREYLKEGDLISGSPTLEQWARYWFKHIVLVSKRPKTVASYRTAMEQYIIPKLGKKRLDQLTPAHVRSLHTYIIDTKKLSPTTAQGAHRVLSLILKAAEREGKIRKNVATLTDAPQTGPSTLVHLSPLHGSNILQIIRGDRLESLTQARLYTGARQGELLGLEIDRVTDRIDLSWQLQRVRWEHGCGEPTGTETITREGKPDLKRPTWACGRIRGTECPKRHVTFPRGSEHRHLQGGLYLVRPKTKSGRRVIPMFDPLAGILERRILAAGDSTKNPHGLVWTNPDGSPIDPSRDNKAWHDILDKAGVPRARVHDARHLNASMLLAAKVPPTVITKILGHSSFVTSEGYMNVEISDLAAALSRSALQLESPTVD